MARCYAGSTVLEFNVPQSTGTSIMACEFHGGVVMGADSRTTVGPYVSNRVTDKITKLTDHIFCCRCGTSADTQAIADIASYHLNFYRTETGQAPLVKMAATVFQKLCYNSRERLVAGFLVAGWDESNGGQIYSVPVGGMMQHDKVAIDGSGSTYVFSYVDAHFRVGMEETEAVKFVTDTLVLAMGRDNYSGGVVRIAVIKQDGVKRSSILGDQLPKFYDQ